MSNYISNQIYTFLNRIITIDTIPFEEIFLKKFLIWLGIVVITLISLIVITKVLSYTKICKKFCVEDFLTGVFSIFLVLSLLYMVCSSIQETISITRNRISETMNNITITTKEEKYPLKLLPNEVFKGSIDTFIINDEQIKLKQRNVSYVEVKNKQDEYILLEKIHINYDELEYVSKNDLNNFIERLNEVSPETFYQIKEIGYINILK